MKKLFLLKWCMALFTIMAMSSCSKEKNCQPCFQFEDPQFGFAKFCVGEPETPTEEALGQLEAKIIEQGLRVMESEKCQK